jgi:hypothetical protein
MLKPWLPPRVQITTVAPKGAKWANAARGGEFNGQTVTSDLLARFRKEHGTKQPVFIMAVTSTAIYSPTTPQYAFVFGSGMSFDNQIATVFGTLPMRVYQPEREVARLTKFMLRYIGDFLCEKPRNNDPRSVQYALVLGTNDLDRMIAKLPADCAR